MRGESLSPHARGEPHRHSRHVSQGLLSPHAKAWRNSPWTITFSGMGQFEIAQYHAMSLELAKAKLLQFPKGSEFVLAVSAQEGEAEAMRQLSSFAKENGLVIKENPGI